MTEKGKKYPKRGFASMDENKQRAIASKGGVAAHKNGAGAHEWTSETARKAGVLGGIRSAAVRRARKLSEPPEAN
jgi:general stress protein YciG